VDAFDADVLIYAAVPDHPLGRRVAALFPPGHVAADSPPVGVGSVLLVPELLSKPLASGKTDETAALTWLLARLDLRPLDAATATLAAALGERYGLRAADAAHLATAVASGADRFITNNHRDFSVTIAEVSVTYPDVLRDSE